jgi:hypothetical protein
MNANNLAELQSLRGWRERSRKAVVFIFETWSSWIGKEKAHLTLLDQFDHVFLFNRASIPNTQRFTSTACTFLPAGADCLSATPFSHDPPRLIDVYSMGRRSETTHRQLLALAQRGEIYYLFRTRPVGRRRSRARMERHSTMTRLCTAASRLEGALCRGESAKSQPGGCLAKMGPAVHRIRRPHSFAGGLGTQGNARTCNHADIRAGT